MEAVLSERYVKPEIIYRGIGNESRVPYIYMRSPRAMLSGANRTFNVLEGADDGEGKDAFLFGT